MNPMKPNGRIPAEIAAPSILVTPADHYIDGWKAGYLGKLNRAPEGATPPNRAAWHRGFLDQIGHICDSDNAYTAAREALTR